MSLGVQKGLIYIVQVIGDRKEDLLKALVNDFLRNVLLGMGTKAFGGLGKHSRLF